MCSGDDKIINLNNEELRALQLKDLKFLNILKSFAKNMVCCVTFAEDAV
ncbi:MAG: hypothetical protein IKE05_04415 [Clostridia bacterium]|nr:hypothetical protein [Clostridia bacterium]